MSRGRRIYLYTFALSGLVVSLAALISFLWRFIGEQAAAMLGATPLKDTLASPALPWLALFLIALAVWIFHIVIANQAARPLTMAGAAERAAPERKMYLYMGRLFVVTAIAVQIWLLIRQAGTAFLDNGVAGLRAAVGWPLGLAAGTVMALAYYVYLRIEASHDGDLGQERGRAVLWRRAYTYLVALVAALLQFIGGGELIRAGIRVLMTPLSRDTTWHGAAAAAAGALIVGIPLGAAAWGAANRAATMNPPSETNALSRVLLRYGGILVTTLVTLVTLGYLVEQVILRAISRPVEAIGHPLLGRFEWPWALAYLPVAALLWINFSGGARTDSVWGGERPRTANIRRVVRYVLTGLSLAAFWYGLTEFAGLILQVFLGADAATGSASEWVQRFATSAAFLLVGAPAWWGHWWSQQMRVRTEAYEGRADLGERASMVRRSYLVAVVLIGAVVVVAAAGFAAFLALNWSSAANLGGVRAAVAAAGAAALVALFWMLVHGLILRGDLRYAAATQSPAQQAAVSAPMVAAPVAAGFAVVPPVLAVPVAAAAVPAPAAGRPVAPVPAAAAAAVLAGSERTQGEAVGMEAESAGREIRREDLAPIAAQVGATEAGVLRPPYALAVIDGGDGTVGARLLGALRGAFPRAVLWPFGLNEAAHRAMLNALGPDESPRMPEDGFDQVAAILAPSDVLIAGGLGGQVTVGLLDALARTNARIVLLPPRDARLKWVAAPKWPLERWIENAVIEAGNALEG